MQLYSTKNTAANFTLKEAIFKGLPDDSGLFMPHVIPVLPKSFFENIRHLSLQEIAFEVSKNILQGSVDDKSLKAIVEDAINFEVPLVELDENIHALELFHGPTFAFKDFGARFMSRLMAHFIDEKREKVHILVATSGDTGSAVAHGFLGVPGIQVTILYPGGKVSEVQEKQFTTLGNNITALEVAGTFDDCQRLVKQAFADQELNAILELTSANSINIARLIPQSFYYFYAYSRLGKDKPLVFSVPSGNFGNILGGLLAWKMGLPVSKFIASTNANCVVPEYLKTGDFNPRSSLRTISNAMDVGNPSNFERILDVFQRDHQNISQQIEGKFYTDEDVKEVIKTVYREKGYIIDPHSAIGYQGLKDYLSETSADVQGVFLGTAHPAKFGEVVEPLLEKKVALPPALKEALEKPSQSHPMSADFDDFKKYLLKVVGA